MVDIQKIHRSTIWLGQVVETLDVKKKSSLISSMQCDTMKMSAKVTHELQLASPFARDTFQNKVALKIFSKVSVSHQNVILQNHFLFVSIQEFSIFFAGLSAQPMCGAIFANEKKKTAKHMAATVSFVLSSFVLSRKCPGNLWRPLLLAQQYLLLGKKYKYMEKNTTLGRVEKRSTLTFLTQTADNVGGIQN